MSTLSYGVANDAPKGLISESDSGIDAFKTVEVSTVVVSGDQTISPTKYDTRVLFTVSVAGDITVSDGIYDGQIVRFARGTGVGACNIDINDGETQLTSVGGSVSIKWILADKEWAITSVIDLPL